MKRLLLFSMLQTDYWGHKGEHFLLHEFAQYFLLSRRGPNINVGVSKDFTTILSLHNTESDFDVFRPSRFDDWYGKS